MGDRGRRTGAVVPRATQADHPIRRAQTITLMPGSSVPRRSLDPLGGLLERFADLVELAGVDAVGLAFEHR